MLRQLFGAVLAGVEQAYSVPRPSIGHDLFNQPRVLPDRLFRRAAELRTDSGNQTLWRSGAELQDPRLGRRFVAEQMIREGL